MEPSGRTPLLPEHLHHPKLMCRADGRYEVRCPRCAEVPHHDPPIGIGLPVSNRAEAEGMVANHSRDPD